MEGNMYSGINWSYCRPHGSGYCSIAITYFRITLDQSPKQSRLKWTFKIEGCSALSAAADTVSEEDAPKIFHGIFRDLKPNSNS